MPRFMGFVRMEENIGMPPKSLFEAMDVFIGERAADGRFVDGGGLYGTEDAVNYVVKGGEPPKHDEELIRLVQATYKKATAQRKWRLFSELYKIEAAKVSSPSHSQASRLLSSADK